MIARLRDARANLPVAAALAERRGGEAWDLLMKSEGDYDRLLARAAILGDVMNEEIDEGKPLGPLNPWNEQVFRNVFERRASIVAEKIKRLVAIGRIALDGDLHEGKGTVRERFRKGERLMDGAQDQAQRERYAAQVEALRSRLLDTVLPDDDGTLRLLTKDLELWLHRQADAYKAMTPAMRTAACVDRGYTIAPEFPNGWLAGYLNAEDRQVLADLGM